LQSSSESPQGRAARIGYADLQIPGPLDIGLDDQKSCARSYAIQRPNKDRSLMTRAELEHKMASLLWRFQARSLAIFVIRRTCGRFGCQTLSSRW